MASGRSARARNGAKSTANAPIVSFAYYSVGFVSFISGGNYFTPFGRACLEREVFQDVTYAITTKCNDAYSYVVVVLIIYVSRSRWINRYHHPDKVNAIRYLTDS